MELVYRHPFLLIIFFSLLLIQCGEADEKSPQQVLNYFDLLESVPSEAIILRATEIASKQPVSVNSERSIEYGFAPGTYVSLACYWWPDASSENGLPYVRKDGAVNPETRSEVSDLPDLIEMAKRVELLSAAYQVTGDSLFAERAISQLRLWFVDRNTAMLPHLEHAQMIQGRDLGRSYGVIDTWWLVRIIDSVPVLEQSDFWTDEMKSGLKSWFTHYLNWLRNSEFGMEEMQSKNNHGTWYDVQIVTFANFVGQHNYAEQHLHSITQKRLNRQIARSGKQRYETRRPKPEHYSIYNLNGWFELVLQAEKAGINLHQSNSVWNGSIEDALFYLIRMIQTSNFDDILDPLDRTDSDRLYLDLLLKSTSNFNHELIFREIERMMPLVRYPEIVLLRNADLLLEPSVSGL